VAAGSSLTDFSTLKMEAIHSSETSAHNLHGAISQRTAFFKYKLLEAPCYTNVELGQINIKASNTVTQPLSEPLRNLISSDCKNVFVQIFRAFMSKFNPDPQAQQNVKKLTYDIACLKL
jgi:hypothetical protein